MTETFKSIKKKLLITFSCI